MAVSATDEAAGVCVSGLVPVEDQQQVRACACVLRTACPVKQLQVELRGCPPRTCPSCCVCMCDDTPST